MRDRTMMNPAAAVNVKDHPVAASESQSLIGELNATIAVLYPNPDDCSWTFKQPDPADGAFCVAFDSATGEPCGCGAFRVIHDEVELPQTLPLARPGKIAELKRMYVRPEFRGRGIGEALVRGLEQRAMALGVSVIVLESGYLLESALRLYRRCEYVPIAPYGEYRLKREGVSACFARVLIQANE